MRLALKVDVDTLDGTRSGVPELLRLFDRHKVRATFLFSLGPDHTGRALRRIFRPGFFAKVRRTSVVSHYGWRTLLYGTLLPGPDIGRRAADVMRSAARAGHEVGVHCFDHVLWQDHVAGKSPAWTRRQLLLARERFEEIFGRPAAVHGAAGWQMNPSAYALEAELGFRYASDTRGRCPYQPVIDGVEAGCPQLPSTLPTLDELIGRDDLRDATPEATLSQATERGLASGHVFTLHAEIEGGQLRDTFDGLLSTWKAQGYAVGTLEESHAALDVAKLPRCLTAYGSVPGRSGTLAVQGGEAASRSAS
jgi:peptidoglycan/xylan/chitin deacetylase (PgdA/CDA1 family)